MEDKKADHSFLMLKQSLEMQLSASEKEIQQSKLVQSEARQAKASSETDLDGSSKETWATTSRPCGSFRRAVPRLTQTSRSQRSTSRRSMEALDKAQKVLQETSGASARVYGMLQIKAHQPEDLTASFQVVRMVRTLAKKSRSETLEDLAANIESLVQTRQAPDVFAKVKDMIESMIASRKQEAASEQTKKAYCEEEKGKTKTKLDELSSKEESLGAKVDQKTSQAATLKTEAAELQKELAQLTQLQVEMDETRKAESAEFKKQKVDLQSGLEGVRSAISVLRDYYSSSSGSATGILSMLEVVESDFGRSLAEAETVEASKAQVQKETDAKFKSKTSADLSKADLRASGQAVLDLAADSETMKEELAAVLSYQKSFQLAFHGLQRSNCLEVLATFEEASTQRSVSFKPWALVTLGRASPAVVQDAFAEATCRLELGKAKPMELASLWWSACMAGASNRRFTHSLGQLARDQVHNFDFDELLVVLWGACGMPDLLLQLAFQREFAQRLSRLDWADLPLRFQQKLAQDAIGRQRHAK
ncbi:unnamed protein product [Effrenium voratum]|nr:unnamed protein product [Effrenium voratum]